jgi:sugar lactone lactonase YvrE
MESKFFKSASVFIDASLGVTRLSHPEGLAVHPDGSVWCGGDRGEIYRISSDGQSFELVASTGGFTLGMTFDRHGNLYTCDLGDSSVYKLDTSTNQLSRFTNPKLGMKVPNYPVLDITRNRLLVSDSHEAHKPGPGIWAIDLDSGEGELWSTENFDFANGLVLTADQNSLLVVESWGRSISKIAINTDGSAGPKSIFLTNLPAIPDGLAFDNLGNLFIACYEPSQIMVLDTNGNLEILLKDIDAHLLCHPTNIAFRGSDLFTANLGRWHITKIETNTSGRILNF